MQATNVPVIEEEKQPLHQQSSNYDSLPVSDF